MNKYPEYDLRMEEIHHTQKKDAPSGTAITAAEIAINELNDKDGWRLGNIGTETSKVYIDAIREEGVPGTHNLIFQSDIDTIELKHTAHSRDGFVQGALLQQNTLSGKKEFLR